MKCPFCNAVNPGWHGIDGTKIIWSWPRCKACDHQIGSSELKKLFEEDKKLLQKPRRMIQI